MVAFFLIYFEMSDVGWMLHTLQTVNIRGMSMFGADHCVGQWRIQDFTIGGGGQKSYFDRKSKSSRSKKEKIKVVKIPSKPPFK